MAEMEVPLLDLKAQFAQIEGELRAAIERVVQSQRFILGEEVEQFEAELAHYCGTAYAVGCASGTDALLLSLVACGVERDTEVITTPYTFFATVGSIVRAGARPVFVDIDPHTFNINVDEAIAAIGPKTRAIIPVHLFGQPAEMGPLLDAASRHGIDLIEDACQAIGAEWHGKRAGSIGTTGAFSFFPSKNLGGFGDGGAVTTNSEELAAKLRALRVHGMHERYYHRWIGWNSRLDAIQAAVLRVKLQYLETWTEARRKNAERYYGLFEAHNLLDAVALPDPGPSHVRHVFNQFVICVPAVHRDPLREHLRNRGIGTEVYYPVPLHLQEALRFLGYQKGQFPHAEAAAEESLALPVYPELTEAQQQYVVEAIAEYFRGH